MCSLRDRAHRKSVFLSAAAMCADGTEHVVRVCNVSPDGLAGEALIPLDVGERLSVELKIFGKIRGRVAWVRGNKFGMTFDTSLGVVDFRRPATK